MQQYIKGFSHIIQPIYASIQHTINKQSQNLKTPVNWAEKCQEAADIVVKNLSETILIIPIARDNFVIETNASNSHIAAILFIIRSYQQFPVKFYLKKLTTAAKGYHTMEKEAFVIVK